MKIRDAVGLCREVELLIYVLIDVHDHEGKGAF
jgi:hypothetical protein